jgi:UDP-4-amino-4,6-dideoxy-N-acetyl-beta-L-altrosamine transaminase
VKTFRPDGRQVIDDDDVAAVERVLRAPLLTTGPVVSQFEDALRQTVEAPFAIACSSGTAGLHLAILAAGIGPGDIVVVPSITFSATANCARYVGADVVFADVDADSGLMTVDTFMAALDRCGRQPAAVLPVDLAGQTPALEEIASVAAKRGIIVIEDGCHALGSVYPSGSQDVRVGSCTHSDFCVFSFHPVKAITMGEGGAVTCKTAAHANALTRLRSHGISRSVDSFVDQSLAGLDDGAVANPWYYELQDLGFNYRASDIHCALGLSQLQKLDGFLERRRALVAQYDEAFEKLSPSLAPIARMPSVAVGWHLYVALIDFESLGISRRDVMIKLANRGIGTQVHYIPLHRQPYYVGLYGNVSLPGADRYYNRCLSLPLFASMTDCDVVRVVDALKAVLRL